MALKRYGRGCAGLIGTVDRQTPSGIKINLHPINQVLLVDLLISFTNRNNNRVLVATHSPLVAEAINNHLHLGLLKNAGVDVEDIVR
jgi:ABC-type lipoprotein export system ATPase subunit